ncbi:synaptonemal complex central element protein 2 isoform X1 [Grammomys surdaster]|uniref:synaptonemal complex central element protein 2 isoform X1 n=1 Tax=Grammomys surdaster TaxID=491861 RepID=UPI00109F0573|nr:synaptonemal complex central element protein 2 isoform X1 [Grammomys surdaster]
MERQGSWLCSQVAVPPVELRDQEPPAIVESGEHQQNENHEETPTSVAPSASCQLPGPFSSLDSSIETLKKKAQELIENINESRQKDHALMTNFRDSLKMKVSDLTEKLEERMYQVYSHHSKIIQERLQEFTQKMAKISHLEMELKQVCQTVETVYKDLCVQSEVPTSEEQNYKDGEC